MTKENIRQSQQQTDLISSNNHGYEMRHVMLITDTTITWNVLEHNTSRDIGNLFLHLHQNIEKIKNAMKSGHTVVLLHLDEVYDSLYDVLNQIYLKVETIRVQIHCWTPVHPPRSTGTSY